MALKVIGTGMGRTGTMSLKLALEQLGYGKCYHMYELIHNPEQIVHFEKARNGGDADWDSLFTGYLSSVDYPAILFYKQLVEKYPDAKIIHTIRDADAWYKSFSDTIMWASRPSFGRIFKLAIQLPFSKRKRKLLKVFQFNGKHIKETFGDEPDNKEHIIKVYKDWNEEALRTLPKERLLVYDVKEGWAPLCAFLGVPVPQTEFPKANSTREFIANVKNN